MSGHPERPSERREQSFQIPKNATRKKTQVFVAVRPSKKNETISICLKPTTFFVKYTFESGRDLPEARDVMIKILERSPNSVLGYKTCEILVFCLTRFFYVG